MKNLLIISVAAFFFSCKNDNLKIYPVADFTFRRSYAGHGNWSDKKLDSVEQLRPELINSNDDSFRIQKLLEEKKILVDGSLDEKTLNFQCSDLANSIDTAYQICKVFYDSKLNTQVLEVKNGKRRIRYNLNNRNPVEYKAIDLIKGGQKEIIILERYYIMNGDNFGLQVFEVK